MEKEIVVDDVQKARAEITKAQPHIAKVEDLETHNALVRLSLALRYLTGGFDDDEEPESD
jgi:hypothetical protein